MLHVARDGLVHAPRRGSGIEAERCADLVADRGRRTGRVELHLPAQEVVGVEVAQDDVGVGHCRVLPAVAVTDGAGVWARALGTDFDDSELDLGDRASAGADLDQVDGWRGDREPGADAHQRLVDVEAALHAWRAALDEAYLGR